jgi:AcrR family transcriptional regulator
MSTRVEKQMPERKSRNAMVAETRAKLISAGRKAFSELGYEGASMDHFTADVGLTRGALYHHFGDKRGLFQAVVAAVDVEMAQRLEERVRAQPNRWFAFVEEGIGYIEMALEPDISRILLRDGPAVLGDPGSWPNSSGCVDALRASLIQLMADRTIRSIDPDATARLLSGASSAAASWIAHAENPKAVSKAAIQAYRDLVEGLRSVK